MHALKSSRSRSPRFGTYLSTKFICVETDRTDVKVSRPAWSRDHIFGLGLGLGLIVVGLGLGLMKCRSRSHGSWSRGLSG